MNQATDPHNPDPYNLARFLHAQASTYNTACNELRTGRKRSHWMWFIFPQVRGLGRSSISMEYAISSLAEAQAYLQHPVLGERLRHVTQLVAAIERKSLYDIFGGPDDQKFCSSMTLFSLASGEDASGESLFASAISKFPDGRFDEQTRAILSKLP